MLRLLTLAALVCSLVLPRLASAHPAAIPLTLRLQTTCPTGQVRLYGLLAASAVGSSGLTTLDGNGLRWTRPLGTPLSLPLMVVPTGEAMQVRLGRCDAGPLRLELLGAGGQVLLRHESKGGPKDRWFRLDPAALARLPAAPRRDYGKQVLAFFYGWYGAPGGPAKRWLHWNPDTPHHDSTHTPVLGWHDSADEAALAQQMQWARQAGLDGLVVSLWLSDPHQALMVQRLLTAAQAADLRVGGYLEVGDTPEQVAQQLAELAAGPASHPAWLRSHGQPVLFLYVRIVAMLGKDGLQKLRQLEAQQAAAAGRKPFLLIADTMQPQLLPGADGLHAYMPGTYPAAYRTELQTAALHARLHDGLVVATVVPGFDDTNIRQPGTVVHRDGTRTYEANWAAAARADWVIITSWNEWHEGSCIEPATEYGEQFLALTRRLATAWRRGSLPASGR